MASRDDEIMKLAKFIGDYNMQKGSIDERYLPYVREVAAAIYDVGYRKSAENVKGIFVSEWDGGIKVETSCMVNLETRRVYDIEQCSDNADMFENFETEYILLNNERYPVFKQDELSEGDKISFWY